MPHRLEQVNELIRQQLNQLLLTEVDFPPDCLVTIVKVETSPDLRHAKIFISVLPNDQEKKVLVILKHHVGLLQFELNKKLAFRPLPRIRFLIDETEKKAADIEALLDKIKKETEG